MRRHRIKREDPEPSSSYSRGQEDHDLAYYIHDRVELMHQVFSALKPKDLKAMTPACISHLSLDNIKELCTEELLGISSKRLCAILDGAEPPSDTESSLSASPEHLETISLDSISSDEEILSQASKKSKKKHRHRDKSKKKKRSQSPGAEGGEGSRAARAGLTVLELLELQARARAIRAQLQQERAAKKATDAAAESGHEASSDDEVLVKEEPPEVVEISSGDDEKPSVVELEKEEQNASTETEKTDGSQTVTKRINNLVITVPQSTTTRKIKLNRTKSHPAANNEQATTSAASTESPCIEQSKVDKTNEVVTVANKPAVKDVRNKDKPKKKKKKKDKKKTIDKDGSDHDEIMIQLSDSEKLDLLEDLDRKTYEIVSSHSSEDSESSSSDNDSDDSSCYEVEGAVLSKEPTAKEIEALSAKIDEIERVEVVTEEEIKAHEQALVEKSKAEEENLEQISWKDRYLDSTKVKKVLTTSNILNALRKKNKELKKKLEESKSKDSDVQVSVAETKESETEVRQSGVQAAQEEVTAEKQDEGNFEEGSIEQYNTLHGSTKYVDPVKEPEVNTEEKNQETDVEKQKDSVVTKEMKKDAKQLLKMYKRLLKYNDMNKQKDPNKKKKKKKKKSKDSENVASVEKSGN